MAVSKTVLLTLYLLFFSFSEPLRLSAIPPTFHSPLALSHSAYFSQNHHHLRHSLLHDSYQQVPLKTNHKGFKLHLKVQGLDYYLNMDTGSSDIFIKGQDSSGDPQVKYRSGEDYLSKDVIKIAYLDGPLNTYEAVLNVQFNNEKFEAPLLVAYTNGIQFDDMDGIVGLSFPSLARHQPTFIQTLMKNNLISKYAYGMNLNLIQADRSFVSFGQQDHELFQGELQYFNMISQKELKLRFNWLSFGNGKKMRIKTALLDTGNTCISIPHSFEKEILRAFRTQNNDCFFKVEENVPMFSLLICKVGNFDELPKLNLVFQKNVYQIEKQYYLQDCSKAESSQDYICYTYIQSAKFDRGTVILGDGFFNRFYTFFDLEEKRIGIAKNRQNITLSEIIRQNESEDEKTE